MKREVITNPQLRKHDLTSTETLGKTSPKFGFKKVLVLSLPLSLSQSHEFVAGYYSFGKY
jgi:hypothetical protein